MVIAIIIIIIIFFVLPVSCFVAFNYGVLTGRIAERNKILGQIKLYQKSCAKAITNSKGVKYVEIASIYHWIDMLFDILTMSEEDFLQIWSPDVVTKRFSKKSPD